MNNKERNNKKMFALHLWTNGECKKDIAKKVGITEKTAGRWINQSPQVAAQKLLPKLQKRLYDEAETLKPYEVENLTRAIERTHEMAYPVDIVY